MTPEATNVQTSPATPQTTSEAKRDKTADSLLFTLCAAMFAVAVLVSILIVEPNAALMVATFCFLVVLVGAVGMFLMRFIDAEH